MVNAALENTTAMTMGSDLDTVGRNRIENELRSHKSLCRGNGQNVIPDCLQESACSDISE
jgi:hypothetical protein